MGPDGTTLYEPFGEPTRTALCDYACHGYLVSAAGARKLVQWARAPRPHGGFDRGIDCWILDGVPLLRTLITYELLVSEEKQRSADVMRSAIIDIATGRHVGCMGDEEGERTPRVC